MPKVRMNSLVGLRTKWSMKNEQVWKKCQRFGGISLMITGILTILVSLLTGGILCFILSLTLILGDCGLCVWYSRPRRQRNDIRERILFKKERFHIIIDTRRNLFGLRRFPANRFVRKVRVTMTRYEMIVIGGGPAGISAAINAFAYLQA